MATHSSILDWRIPWTEKPGSYSPWGHKESDTIEQPSHSSEIFPDCHSQVVRLRFFCNTSVFITFIALITVSQ